MSEWKPLSERETPLAESNFDALHEGVPPWLRGPLLDWTRPKIGSYSRPRNGTWRLIARLRLGAGSDLQDATGILLTAIESSSQFLLEVVDALLAETHSEGWPGAAEQDEAQRLDQLLSLGGSIYRVQFEPDRRLVRRLPEGVVDHLDHIVRTAGTAGRLLGAAVTEAFGRSPKPGEAYSLSIKAVEAAMAPVISPNDSEATLGKMIAAIRHSPGKWASSVNNTSDETHSGIELVKDAARLLWQGHTDRHGSPDHEPVTDREAQMAVHLAAFLVSVLSDGSISRVP